LDELQELIESKYHEERFIALVILTHKYKTKLKDTKLRDKNEESCYQFYLKNMKHVNNWDLVDCSAPNIMGSYLLQEKRK
jgi:3-methyladenine DNA glycosylase AlkD